MNFTKKKIGKLRGAQSFGYSRFLKRCFVGFLVLFLNLGFISCRSSEIQTNSDNSSTGTINTRIPTDTVLGSQVGSVMPATTVMDSALRSTIIPTVVVPVSTQTDLVSKYLRSLENFVVEQNIPNTALAFGNSKGAINIYNSANGTLLATVGTQQKGVAALFFSADGKFLASGSQDDKTISLWRTDDWKISGSLVSTFSSIQSLAFSADNSLRAITGVDPLREEPATGCENPSNNVQLWSLTSKSMRTQLLGRQGGGEIGPFAFSPDGKNLVFGTRFGLQLWTVNDILHLKTPLQHGFLTITRLSVEPKVVWKRLDLAMTEVYWHRRSVLIAFPVIRMKLGFSFGQPGPNRN